MKTINPIISLFSLVFLFTALFTLCVPADAHESKDPKTEIVRAKIGVQVLSGDRTFSARGRQQLVPGDLIRLYIHTEKQCYVYVVHTDQHTARLLNITEQKIQSSTLILPSAQTYYKLDGMNEWVSLTVICTPDKLVEFADMETDPLDYAAWQSMEQRLQEQSRLLVPEETGPPIVVGGNVRGLGSNVLDEHAAAGAFLRGLPTFSGNGLLIRTYEFQVQ